MFDTAAARRMMVDGQVRTADVTNLNLIDAMLAVPRELFVPPAVAGQAYLDSDIAVAKGRALLKPMVLAKLLQAADVAEGDHVLDVGCATGYSSAVLARLAGAVIALEEDAGLAERARENLRAAGASQVQIVSGPLADGAPAHGPYDVILVNGALEVAPKVLLHQLKPGGRLVGVLGRGPAGKAMLYCSIGGDCGGRPIFDAAAPLLPGFAAPAAFVF